MCVCKYYILLFRSPKPRKASCTRKGGKCVMYVCMHNVRVFLFSCFSRRNDHPWQKRWVTFNGSELKYFRNKSDKESSFLNTVELDKMIDVKRVPDVSV